ncbi:V-type ATPase subunit [Streptomyces sp. NA02950]|uniref:V-type ATPase subunit n=1 Tax=Streptomyces sp. NA02950 TaxID=2742137 RepID=UPI001590B13B|nr:V-type ATPase subunit [Streptomyces sp. NA02950]QKV90603.1 V-type ATPase subunit [Streptomyces sp. NA02950]
MGAGWVAGVTRARAMLSRALGRAEAKEVASAPGLDAAVRHLSASPYGRGMLPGTSLDDAQRAVTAALLWHLRVLAGWQPLSGASAIRLLASGFEIANAEDHLRTLTGTGRARAPYRLGALAMAWPRLARTGSPRQLRAALAASGWGDPGAATPAAVAVGMRVSAAVRTATAVPEAARWAAGRLALLVGRHVFVARRPLPRVSAERAERLLGAKAVAAASFADYRRELPPAARWAVAGLAGEADLWRAEGWWWDRLDEDGRALLRGSRPGRATVLGAVAVLSADAWRVRGALEGAARGGGCVEACDAPA